MKSTRNYVRRPIPRTLRAQLENTAREAHRIANTYTGRRVSVAIHAQNEHNPNGVAAYVDEHGAVRVERWINLAWAKQNGYRS